MPLWNARWRSGPCERGAWLADHLRSWRDLPPRRANARTRIDNYSGIVRSADRSPKIDLQECRLRGDPPTLNAPTRQASQSVEPEGHRIAAQRQLAGKTRRALGPLVKLSGGRSRECGSGF